MKIAFTTTFDAQNRATWPREHLGLYGASARIAQTLADQGNDLLYIGGLSRQRSPVTRLKWLYYRHLQHKDYYSWVEPLVIKHYGQQIMRQVAESEADLVLCPENAIPIARVKTSQPLVLWTDALLGSLMGFYPYLSNLARETQRKLLAMEQSAVQSCDRIILTSEWAVQSAIDLYGVPREKLAIVPRGSNQAKTFSPEQVKQKIEQRPQSPCRLVFVGVDWHRKGGDTALKAVQALNQRGVDAELWVIGCQPQFDGTLPPYVKPQGFIDQSTEAGRRRMADLLVSSHFLILPTRADTFGIVFSEACALGLPCLATQVGGVPTVIRDDANGKTFPLQAHPDAYAEYVADCMAGGRYTQLAYSTLEEYQSRLSWQAASEKVKHILHSLV